MKPVSIARPGSARERRWMSWVTSLVMSGAACFALAATLGCATRSTTTEVVGDGKDIVTASDESDAGKRARLRMELAAAYFGRGQMTTALDQVKLALQADPALAEAYNK